MNNIDKFVFIVTEDNAPAGVTLAVTHGLDTRDVMVVGRSANGGKTSINAVVQDENIVLVTASHGFDAGDRIVIIG